MNRSKRTVCAWIATMVLCLSACSDTSVSDSASLTDDSAADQAADVVLEATWDKEDDLDAPDLQNATTIVLSDHGSTVQGDGVAVKKSVVTITQGGIYAISGSLSDGQLRVESTDDQTVHLVLGGVDIHSKTTAPLFVKKAAKAVITLATDTDNRLSDAVDAVFEDAEKEEPSGTLFSKSDLTVNGDGSLTVTAVFRDGIVSRDGLKLARGRITVDAADDAIMGRDYVWMRGGEYILTAKGDGIKSTNDGGEHVGWVRIEDGTTDVTCETDGIQATTALRIDGGIVRVTAGGGHENGAANTAHDFGWGQQSVDSETVGKGLKAGTALMFRGGTVSVDAADDAIHSNGSVTVSGGNVTAASGDDGVHADVSVAVDGGCLTVTDSYEALEAATIAINGGDISLTASDDGINASSGTEGSTGDPRGQNPFASDDSLLEIHGGNLTVDASGDGLDSNGTIRMDGGEVWVCGPSSSGNGTLDFGAAFEITGGTLIGVGSLGMAETPTSNTQHSIVWNGCALQSGDTFAVTAEDGTVIASMTSARQAQWAYVTSPLLEEGGTYTVSDGTDSETLTLTDGENTIGTASGGFGGPGGGGRPGGFQGMPPNGRF